MITATGTVNAVTTVLVGTQVSGTIKTLHVDFNSRVKKGQSSPRSTPPFSSPRCSRPGRTWSLQRPTWKNREAALVDAKRTLDRNKELFSKNLIARSDLDTAETNYDSADAQVNANKAQMEQAEAALSTAETNLAYTRSSRRSTAS